MQFTSSCKNICLSQWNGVEVQQVSAHKYTVHNSGKC